MGDLVGPQAIGIARPIPPLVVTADDGPDQAPDSQRQQDLGTDQRVALHLGALLIAQGPGFMRTSSRIPILPTSWSTAPYPIASHSVLVLARQAREGQRALRHAAAVVFRGRILGVDRTGQGRQAVLGCFQARQGR